ncbi:MAG: SDR family oxidoreductase [Myxococcota bacterium]|nr:SDR family oxidoreductase [Myxococcota bacterium]
MAQEGRIAVVTGASRGIGKATALALADAGFDLVLAARTVKSGDEHPDMVRNADGSALPGSLEETRDAVLDKGRRARLQRLDLLETPTIQALVDDTLAEWGRIDVLVNNAIYQGPGLMADFLEGSIDELEKVFQGNVIAQVRLTRLVLRDMLERDGGIVVNLTSQAGMIDPPLKLAQGGWGYAHGATKAALHRMAGYLHVEYGDRGIRAYNLEPGLVRSESLIASLGEDTELEKMGVKSAPVEVPEAVIRWLCTAEDAIAMSGQNVYAQPFCKKNELLPGWP